MSVKELRDKLNRLMEELPNTTNDEIYYLDPNHDIQYMNKISIEWDLDFEGRYICLK